MPNGIVISAYTHLAGVARTVKIAAAVSILGNEDRLDWPSFAPRPTLRLKFDDTWGDSTVSTAPKASHIRELIDFCRSWDGRDVLLFHCRAGSSRSPAAAMIAAVALGRDDLVSKIASARSYFRPNRKMLHLGEELLGISAGLTKINNDFLPSRRADRQMPVLIVTSTQ